MSNDETKKEKLTVKEARFVKVMANGDVPASTAIIEAGYKPSTKESAYSMSSQLMANPKIQNALQHEIDRQFPDMTKEAANVIWGILQDPEARAGDKLKAIELLAKVCSWFAPTKHTGLNINVNEKFKLPEE